MLTSAGGGIDTGDRQDALAWQAWLHNLRICGRARQPATIVAQRMGASDAAGSGS